MRELRARGIDRVRVRVMKVPRAGVLAAEDAVKVEAPELIGDGDDSGLYVRLAFLDLPAVPPRFAPATMPDGGTLPRRVKPL